MLKNLFTLCAILSLGITSMAESPNIHSNEEMISIVLNSKEFQAAKPKVGNLQLEKILVESNGMNPTTIYFEYGEGNPAPCEIQATIPIHFDAPTSVNVVCNGAKADPGFGHMLPPARQ